MPADSPIGVKLRTPSPRASGRIGSKIIWISGILFFSLFLLVGYVMIHHQAQKRQQSQKSVTQTIAAGPANSLIAVVNPPAPDTKPSPMGGQTPEQVPSAAVPLIIKGDGQVPVQQGQPQPTAYAMPGAPGTPAIGVYAPAQPQYSVTPAVDQAEAERTKAEMEFEMKRRDADLRPAIPKTANAPPVERTAAPVNTPDPAIAPPSPNPLMALNRLQNPVNAAADETRAAQQNKADFLKPGDEQADDYLHAVRTMPVSQFEIQQGTPIRATTVASATSDVPGMITAVVRENVYDALCNKTRPDGTRHCYILIPAGSRLIGEYNANVAYAQSRLQTVWTRIIFPDTSFIDLGKMSGYGADGSAGFKDQVSNHWKRLIGTALLTSALTAGFQISQNHGSQSTLAYPSTGQVLAAAVGMEGNQIGGQIMSRAVNVPPSITIRAGYPFAVLVTKDIVFNQPYSSR